MKRRIYQILLILLWANLWMFCIHRSNRDKKENKQIASIETNERNDAIKDKDVYDDIDLFNLQGLKQIKNPIKYPYIKIESLGNQRKIIYKRSAKDSTERLYQKKDNYWLTSYLYKGDTGYFKTYEYITPKKIIEIDYGGTWEKTNFYLNDIFIHEKNSVITYVINSYGKQKINIQPGINIPEDFKNKAERIITEKYNSENGILKIVKSIYDVPSNKVSYKDTSCYLADDHSWFWWSYFGG